MNTRENFDSPLQAHSLERLSVRERARYCRAISLLASEGDVGALPRRNMALSGRGVFEALLAQSWNTRFSDPQQMIHLAEVAVEVAQNFDPRGIGKKRVLDLQARAWGELANALRARDQIRPAQMAFGTAFSLIEKGTGDIALKARLFDLEASLLGTLREFDLSLRRLATVTNLYRSLGELHFAGRAIVTQALYTYYKGETENAIELNNEGMALLDIERDPALYAMALHNHLLFLVELGKYAQAKRKLFKNRRHLIFKSVIGALRLRWIEGRICYGLGELMSAELAFCETSTGFNQAGMHLHGALASLELAAALLSQGRADEAEEKVIETREVFASLAIYREFLGSVIFLEECFRLRVATPDLIQDTVAFLWRKARRTAPQRA